jgi:phosphoribosylamine-glycine ligase
MSTKKKYKTILLLGGGTEQLPAILEAKKFGYEVVCIDKDKNCVGRKYSDFFYKISIKQTKKIEGIFKKHKINGITSICSDIAVPVVSYLSNKYKLASLDIKQSKILTNKFYMKKFFEKNKIRTPNFHLYKNLNLAKKFINKQKFPIIIKPSVSFGQKGISKITNLKNLEKKITKAKKISLDKKVIIENYEEGIELNVVAIVYNKKTIFLSFSDRIIYQDKGFGIASEHRHPSSIKTKIIKKIKLIVKKIVNKMSLNDAVIYPQFIINKNPQLIEIAGRVPGGYMREVSMLASGIDPVKFQILIAMREKNIYTKIKNVSQKKSTYVKFFTNKDFKIISDINFKNIQKAKSKRGIYKIFFNRIQKIPSLKDSSSRFGVLISYGKNIKESKLNAEKAIKIIKSK